MKEHKQVWVKVNTQVDRQIAPLVSVLSRIKNLETVSSCQGRRREHHGFIYFYCGDWHTIAVICFDVIAPALENIGGWSVSVEVFNNSRPMGKLTFKAEDLGKLSSALKVAFNARKFACSHDRECKAPHS